MTTVILNCKTAKDAYIMINGNFGWIATWKITNRCNLRCPYCNASITKQAAEAEAVNRSAALDVIAARKPRILSVRGGEPSLVKELPELLAKAKDTWDPFIRVVHNGTSLQKFESAFPNIDRLVVSMDGPGAINAASRGISGDAVLGWIGKLLDAPKCPEIVVNTVVTEMNLASLPTFASQIEAVSPKIILALSPVMPVGGALSVLRDGANGYRRFLSVYEEMKDSHSGVLHNLDCVMRHEETRKIQCYNQYFTLRFSPDGEIFPCDVDIDTRLRAVDSAQKRIGNPKVLFTKVVKGVKGSVGMFDFTCRNMCNCESWLDMLLLGKETDYARMAAKGLRERLTDKDCDELEKFAKEHIDPKFDKAAFKNALNVSSEK